LTAFLKLLLKLAFGLLLQIFKWGLTSITMLGAFVSISVTSFMITVLIVQFFYLLWLYLVLANIEVTLVFCHNLFTILKSCN